MKPQAGLSRASITVDDLYEMPFSNKLVLFPQQTEDSMVS